MPACLPEQLCRRRAAGSAGGPTALELVLARGRLREQRPYGVQLLGAGEVRGRRDGKVPLVEVFARACEGKRLQRLRGRAHERDERRVADRDQHLLFADSDRMHPVRGLDRSAPADGHEEGLRRPHAPESGAQLSPPRRTPSP